MNETIINIDNFFGTDDLMLRITRDGFEDLCVDLYREIEKIIHSLINNYGEGITINNIDEVILVGGATKMTAVKTFLGKIFTPKKNKK